MPADTCLFVSIATKFVLIQNCSDNYFDIIVNMYFIFAMEYDFFSTDAEMNNKFYYPNTV